MNKASNDKLQGRCPEAEEHHPGKTVLPSGQDQQDIEKWQRLPKAINPSYEIVLEDNANRSDRQAHGEE